METRIVHEDDNSDEGDNHEPDLEIINWEQLEEELFSARNHQKVKSDNSRLLVSGAIPQRLSRSGESAKSLHVLHNF